MNKYSQSLRDFLANPENKEHEVAARAQTSQASINRYRNGNRFPNADMARRIEGATNGEVPFSVWREAAAEKFGLA